MIVGVLFLEIFFPQSHSLKEKRKRILRLRNRVREKYNVAFAELDHHDKWQRSKIGIVTLNNDRGLIESMFNRILDEAEASIDGEIINSEIQYF